MKHYLVCDNKCLVEGMTKEEINNNLSEINASLSSAAKNAENFTYVVDSDQALADWANNVKDAGQDYTSVLIRKGTWTSTVGVNLSLAKTNVVKGEVGSKLIFRNVGSCLFYFRLPDVKYNYYMDNVHVECNCDESFQGDTALAFTYCINLTNCVGKVVNDTQKAYAFSNCKNLINCVGEAEGKSESLSFKYCNNLIACSATGTSTGSSTGIGFSLCSALTNCTGTGTSAGSSAGIGFHQCSDLINCTGTGTGIGFSQCSALTNCTGTGTSAGFNACSCLTNCIGTGTSAGTGVGFNWCRIVSKSKAGGTCGLSVFQDCYSSYSINPDYSCADTPAGGFNNVANPSS